MFDLSFGKLLLLLIVGLIVIGPAKLPIVMKKILTWVHALRRVSASVQMELNKELKIQEIQDALRKAEQVTADQVSPDLQNAIDELKKLTNELRGNAEEVSKQMNESLDVVKKETQEIQDKVTEDINMTPSDESMSTSDKSKNEQPASNPNPTEDKGTSK